ncbi:gdsl esterase/lipase [Quercus suber]|uniref:Gdsl esterase/lipase n=1 Tax=Quercus suber TaxID=58331 RepID=A0AAW0KXQ0_QUESU
MGRTFIFMHFVVVCLFFFCIVESEAKQPLAPALYVFGDSFVASGNDNILNTDAKANYAPYGIDFPNGTTGRVTNGLTLADFYAQWLGLQVPPPYLLFNQTEKHTEGFNYASGPAGIRPETSTVDHGVFLSMDKQVELFKKTAQEYLPTLFGARKFLVFEIDAMGCEPAFYEKQKNECSDKLTSYISTYNHKLEVELQNLAKTVRGAIFALAKRYQLMYDLVANPTRYGARKFLVFEIDAMGCEPAFYEKQKNECSDKLTSYISTYNHKLEVELQNLAKTVRGAIFALAKRYQLMYDLVANPTRYGLKDSLNPCCSVSQSGLCVPNQAPCQDRKSQVFFDAIHPTEAVYSIIASQCFNGTALCGSLNIQELVSK